MNFGNVREITIGGISKADLLEHLKDKSISMNKYAEMIFADPEFTTSTIPQRVRIVEISLQQISLDKGGVNDEIFSRARDFGCELCPLELGPHFRLQYLNQLEGPYLTVASQKTKDDEDYPNGFYLRKLEDGLWLRGYRATSDYVWPPESRFVFLVSRV